MNLLIEGHGNFCWRHLPLQMHGQMHVTLNLEACDVCLQVADFQAGDVPDSWK